MRAFQITCLSILLSTISAFGQGLPTSTPDVNTIVSRMQTAMAGRNHDRAYSVTREYMLVPEDAAKSSKVVAEVNNIPSGKSDYSITSGSGQAEKVVRKVLDHETEAANQHSGAELTPANYEFAYVGSSAVDGHNCYILQLTPRHEGKEMIRAKLWVDADSFLIRQLQGSPTKMPSWWIKDLQVTLHYKDIDGLWLQDSTTAVAQVRIVGRHVLTSHDVDVRSGVAVASKKSPKDRNANATLLGAGVFRR